MPVERGHYVLMELVLDKLVNLKKCHVPKLQVQKKKSDGLFRDDF